MKLKSLDKVLVIDVEACCWKGNPPTGMYNEIIEIGICTLDCKTKEIEDKTSIIIKPTFSEISYFCTELTTLTPEYIEEKGIVFFDACKFIKEKFKSNTRAWFSWGDYDRTAFEKNCKLLNVQYPFRNTHFNLKTLFAIKYGLKEELGVQGALEKIGMEFEGQQHRGDSDAYNISRILTKIL